MAGGIGNDIYHVNHAGDVVSEAGGGGSDTILASIDTALTGITGIEFLAAEAGAGGLVLGGNAFANQITGGDGDDTLIGDVGADTLTGGLGADTFGYLALADSTTAPSGRDTIIGFSDAEGDQINLSVLDADTTLAGDQAFVFIGGAAFSSLAGELQAQAFGGSVVISGDVDGDGSGDFAIRLLGSPALSGSSFGL